MTYQLVVTLPAVCARLFEDHAESTVLAVSCYVQDEIRGLWRMEALCASKAEAEALRSQLQLLAETQQIVPGPFVIEAVEEKDWVSEVLKTFPPITVGRYFLYGSHVTDPLPANVIPLRIDAGMAFGSGEHATTSGCLEALDALADIIQPAHVLDMGCGSAVLAIAAAKTWPQAQGLGVDIDAVSVRIAEENASDNGVADRLHLIEGDGYAALTPALLGASVPSYNLIFANILANPLIVMAPELAKYLASQGVAILSGFLTKQEDEVIAAHVKEGLQLHARYQRDEWVTAVVKRV